MLAHSVNFFPYAFFFFFFSFGVPPFLSLCLASVYLEHDHAIGTIRKRLKQANCSKERLQSLRQNIAST